ncbi:MAG TPA: hypothetical protein VH601_08745 [Bryobacteraceae bacterium]|jgi:hypothetical protein
MTPFEEQLKKALERREPSDGFTVRVLAHAKQQDRSELEFGSRFLQRLRSWRLIPVLAGALVITGGGVIQRHEREARGEAAKRQLMLAMRIARSKLYDAQVAVREVGR